MVMSHSVRIIKVNMASTVTDRPKQTEEAQICLLLMEQFDQGMFHLPFHHTI